MIQTFALSTFVLLSLNQLGEHPINHHQFGPARIERVHQLLDSYDGELNRSSTLATVSVWGQIAGVQVIIREQGKINVVAYRDHKGFESLENCDITPAECEELFKSVRALIYAFPDDSYIPTESRDPTFYSISYRRGNLTEEVTVEGIDPLDRALVEKTRVMLQTLKNVSEFTRKCSDFEMDELTRAYQKRTARPKNHPAAVYSRGIVPEKYHGIDHDAEGKPVNGVDLTSIRLERSVGRFTTRHDFVTEGLFFDSRAPVDRETDGNEPRTSMWISDEFEMPKKKFLEVHSTLVEIMNQILQEPTRVSRSGDQERFILTTQFGLRTTRVKFSGIDNSNAELVKLFKQVTTGINHKTPKKNTAYMAKMFAFPIDLDELVLP